MRNTILKKLLVVMLVGIITSQFTCFNSAEAADNNSVNKAQQVDKLIGNHILIQNNAFIIVDEKELINQLKEIDGNIMPGKENTEAIKVYYTIKDNIIKYNNDLKKGSAFLLSDGAIIYKNDTSLHLQGGSDYDIQYSWGVRRYMSTSHAGYIANELNKTSGLAGFFGVVFGVASAEAAGVGAIPFAGIAVYSLWVSSDLSYVNSQTNNGVIMDVHYTFYYKITAQSGYSGGRTGDGYSHSSAGGNF